MPQEEILTMCASGKDRTGLAEHDQSAQALQTYLGIDLKEIDRQILKSGHTAQQAGGVSAGGATPGCYGTKNENLPGIPKSRKEFLKAIVEISANSNKIKSPKFFAQIKQFFKKKPKELKVGNGVVVKSETGNHDDLGHIPIPDDLKKKAKEVAKKEVVTSVSERQGSEVPYAETKSDKRGAGTSIV